MLNRWQPDGCCRYETRGDDAGSSDGTTVTASASTNTKGSWTNIGAVTSFTYEMLLVGLTNRGTLADIVVDIGISDGSNRWLIAGDLRVMGLKSARVGNSLSAMPLHVPAGSQLSARCAGSVGSAAVSVTLIGSSSGIGGLPGYSHSYPLYSAAGSSCGVEIDPTVAHTKTGYTEITASTPRRVCAVMMGFGPGGEVTRSGSRNYLVDIARGAGGSEDVIFSNIPLASDPNSDMPFPSYCGPLAMDLPLGTRLSARAQVDDVTAGARKLDVAMWGFVR